MSRLRFIWPRALLLVAALVSLAGCVGPALPTDQLLVTNDPKLAGTVVRDKVLWQYRLGLAALRAGEYDEAKQRFDDAILTMGGILADREDAKRARSLWSGEERKTFIGEPYERVMAYYYRAILYWRDGEPDNARACFRSGQLLDSVAEEGDYRADYVLLDYLDGLASAKLAADGSDAFARAEKSAKHKLPAYEKNDNVLVFAEWGRGPLKFADGEYGEKLRFGEPQSAAASARLLVDGRTAALAPWDDLYFQATTRGGRVMDYILGNKAVFKGTADTVGDLSLIGAAIAHSEAERKRAEGESGRGSDQTALALAAIGAFGKILSAATVARADVRAWDNLPRYLGFTALRLRAGDHAAKIEYLDADGRVLEAHTREFTIHVPAEGDRDTVVFLSELAKNPAGG
ncbi:MAG: hypothetical protein HYV96_20645 [Opitutae bacterium]|nr:hypothetical protein [Opitutae bacterium]